MITKSKTPWLAPTHWFARRWVWRHRLVSCAKSAACWLHRFLPVRFCSARNLRAVRRWPLAQSFMTHSMTLWFSPGGEVLYSKTTFTGGCGLMDANYNKNLVVGFAAEMPNGDAVVFCFWFYPLEVWALHDLAALSAPLYEWRPVQLHRSPTPNAGPASTERKKTKKGLLAADKYHVSGGPGTATLAGIPWWAPWTSLLGYGWRSGLALIDAHGFTVAKVMGLKPHDWSLPKFPKMKMQASVKSAGWSRFLIFKYCSGSFYIFPAHAITNIRHSLPFFFPRTTSCASTFPRVEDQSL